MATSKKQLAILKTERDAAIAAYNKYLKQYNEDNNIVGNTLIQEIIALHKKGKTNKEIQELGYNKNTINQQVSLFKKGKRVAKTCVAKYLPKKVK